MFNITFISLFICLLDIYRCIHLHYFVVDTYMQNTYMYADHIYIDKHAEYLYAYKSYTYIEIPAGYLCTYIHYTW